MTDAEQKLMRVVSGGRYRFTFLAYDEQKHTKNLKTEVGKVISSTKDIWLVNCGDYVIGVWRESATDIQKA